MGAGLRGEMGTPLILVPMGFENPRYDRFRSRLETEDKRWLPFP